jgi:hypothetical protein
LRLLLSGNEGVRKILEGVFFIISEYSEAFSAKDFEILIDFSKMRINPIIDSILKSIKITELILKEGRFELSLELMK